MIRGSAWGMGKGLDARDCARTAAQQALDRLGTARPSLAVAFVSQDLDCTQALNGLSSMLGTTPIWGCSTIAPFTGDGEVSHAVLVGLIAGTELKAQVQFLPDFSRDSQWASRQLRQIFSEAEEISGALVAADGVNGNFFPVSSAFSIAGFPVGGSLVSGDYHLEKTYLIAGAQTAAGALTTAILSGSFRLGVGAAHGWRATGLNYQVTRARDVWIQSLNGLPAAGAYSQVFGYSARQWANPPLSTYVRLYPLGFSSSPTSENLVLRSPLFVEADGSFRMNAPVLEGETALLMVGDPEACLEASRLAVQQALDSLGGARPLMALVFVDIAWRMLFENRNETLISTLHTALGDLPLLGSYGVGQIIRPGSMMLPLQLNQNLLVVLLGEAR